VPRGLVKTLSFKLSLFTPLLVTCSAISAEVQAYIARKAPKYRALISSGISDGDDDVEAAPRRGAWKGPLPMFLDNDYTCSEEFLQLVENSRFVMWMEASSAHEFMRLVQPWLAERVREIILRMEVLYADRHSRNVDWTFGMRSFSMNGTNLPSAAHDKLPFVRTLVDTFPNLHTVDTWASRPGKHKPSQPCSQVAFELVRLKYRGRFKTVRLLSYSNDDTADGADTTELEEFGFRI